MFQFLMLYMCFFLCDLGVSQSKTQESLHKHKTICLNMIVKNEKDVIKRCLESVLPIIDTWVIVDTGSEDGTQKIIQDFFKEKGISGKLYERPWVNFAYNRNEALALAKDQADYLLFMDADDYLIVSQEFYSLDLVEDFYATASRNGNLESWIARLVKSSIPWKWEGVIHEHITAENVHGVALKEIEYVYTHDGARSKDPKTALRDLKLLESDPSPRNIFYTILTYLQMKQNDEALSACHKRIQMQGDQEELFVAYLIKGSLEKNYLRSYFKAKESFLAAHSLRPHRLEPLYYIGEILWEQKLYVEGYSLMSLAKSAPKDHLDVLFVERWIYDYGILMQCALFAAQTGHYCEALCLTDEVLNNKNLSQIHRQDMERCKVYIKEHVIEQIRESLKNVL